MVPHLVQRFLKHLQKYYFRVSIRMIHRLRGGGGGGVQAYNFGNFNYEIQVEGEGHTRLF